MAARYKSQNLVLSEDVSMALSIVIPNTKREIQKQIKALEYLLTIDTKEKDKQIHSQALADIKKALNKN